MDISIKVGDYLLNYRVSALIKKENKILVHHSLGKDHYTLPGGRVKSGESSIVALKREIKEEMGFDIEYIRPVSLIENFFELNDLNYHELLFTHEVKFKDESIYNIPKIEAIEEEKRDKLEFLWIDINALNEERLLPKKMIDVIKNDKGEFVHYINDERTH